MKAYILDCFCTNEKNSGSPAAVVIDFQGSSAKKQAIAKKLGLPVTAFIFNLDSECPLLEFYHSSAALLLSIQGTIAAAKIFLDKNGGNHCKFIALKSYILHIDQMDNLIQSQVHHQAHPFIQIDHTNVCKMLNLPDEKIFNLDEYSIAISSVGSPKLLIPIKTKSALLNIIPNSSLIKKWSMSNQVNGLYLFAPPEIENNGVDFITRGFNPRSGYTEDDISSAAAGALALYLKETLVLSQGENLNRPCHIVATYIDDARIFVGGKVLLSSMSLDLI